MRTASATAASAAPVALPATDGAADPVAPRRLDWIDVTRGLAIGLVVAYHTLGFLGLPSTIQGQAGVDAFLLISGFGLAYAARRDESLPSFCTRRLWKLLPAYWLILGLCLAFELFRGAEISLRQIVLSVTCTHLIAGHPYAFAINMSFWFMGLIVPLYLWFAMIRRTLTGPNAYTVLGLSAVGAWVLGVVLLEHGLDWGWGADAVGHVPNRLPVFIVGAIVGVAYRRGDGLDRLVREPWLMAAMVFLLPVSIIGSWGMFPFSLLTGAGILLASMFLASADRWRIFRPLTALLVGLGVVAYELYLCHQYLLLTVSPLLIRPHIADWLPRMTPAAVDLMTACLTLAIAVWLAWGIHWLVNRRQARRSWRPTLAAVGTVATALVLVGMIVPARMPKVRPRTFEIAVTLPDRLPTTSISEPIVCFGHQGDGDLVFLEHAGDGRVRIGIQQWGAPLIYSDWTPADTLTERPWKVRIEATGVTVVAGSLRLQSVKPPRVPTARPIVGTNPFGFSSASPLAYSQVERIRRKAPATTPAVVHADEDSAAAD